MSESEAEALTEKLEKRWNAKHTHDFLARMERKMHRRERYGR